MLIRDTQFELFATDTTVNPSLATIIQEPLELLLAKKTLSVFDRRIYWWIMSKLAQYQTLDKEASLPIPEHNLVFKIPVLDLYPKQAESKQASSTLAIGSPADDQLNQAGEKNRRVGKRKGQVTVHASYAYFKEVANQLVEKSIIRVDHMTTIDPTSRKVGSIAIFPRAFYENGVMEVHVDRFIVPAMRMLGKGYTKYEREAAMSLGREGSQILYVRLCRFLDLGEWTVTVDELRSIMSATTYPRYSNFKQRALIPAIDEVNTYSDIGVDYDEIRVSGKVAKIRFKVYRRQERPAHEIKKLRQSIEAEMLTYLAMPFSQRVTLVAPVLPGYLFSRDQQNAILASENKLNKFLDLHLKITDGILKIKKSPTSYMASILFPKGAVQPDPKLF